MTRDGRLSTEELDALLGAGSPPPAQPETDDGADELVLGRGARGPGRRRSVLARHRAATAVITLAVVTVAAGYWWRDDQVPPDTAIAATVVVQRVAGGNGDLITTSLALTPSRPGDQLRAIALQGPGLTMPAVTQDGDAVRAVNVVTCGDLPALTEPQPHTLRVTRTDTGGQEVSRDLPIAGDGDRRVWSAVVDQCVGDAVEGMALRYFAASDNGPAHLRMGLLNTSVWDLYLYGAVASVHPRGDDPVGHSLAYFTTATGPVLLPAGDVTQVGLVPRVEDCPRWHGPVTWAAPAAGPAPGQPRDLTVFVGPAGVPTGSARVADRSFGLYPAQRAAVVRALRLGCTTTPSVHTGVPLID